MKSKKSSTPVAVVPGKDCHKMPRKTATRKTRSKKCQATASDTPEESPIQEEVKPTAVMLPENTGVGHSESEHDVHKQLAELSHLSITGTQDAQDVHEPSSTSADLPHVDDLVVRTEIAYRPATSGELFRISKEKVFLLSLMERTVAVPCGCGTAECAAYVQVGRHGKWATGASSVCPHCFCGPFAGESQASAHWEAGTCKKKAAAAIACLNSTKHHPHQCQS